MYELIAWLVLFLSAVVVSVYHWKTCYWNTKWKNNICFNVLKCQVNSILCVYK